jgi:hypothetical protein
MGEAYYVVNGELYLINMEADFNAIDKDGTGYVEKSELREMASELAYRFSEEELDALMKDTDADKDGKISLGEFIASAVSHCCALFMIKVPVVNLFADSADG